MQRVKSTSGGPGAPTKLPAAGQSSSVGPRAPALPKVKKNTRDYGKPTQPETPGPFGPVVGDLS